MNLTRHMAQSPFIFVKCSSLSLIIHNFYAIIMLSNHEIYNQTAQNNASHGELLLQLDSRLSLVTHFYGSLFELHEFPLC